MKPRFQLSDLISGVYDPYIRRFAAAARRWGHPFFLRFDWEMNGNWFPWAEAANENRAGEYVAAWRHVHNLFESAGATNATWVWCPNAVSAQGAAKLITLYPGNAYVDWTCLDIYNYGTNPSHPTGWESFNRIARPVYREIVGALAPVKPMIVGEAASSEYGGSKARWIRAMLAELSRKFPKIRGVLWFERYDDGMDWPIETSQAATAAFRRGIHRGSYVGHVYGHLGATPIPPPRRR